MKKLILICCVLLAVQLGLTVLTHWPKGSNEAQIAKWPVVAVNPAEIDELVLEDGEGHKLRVKKEHDRWLLPEQDGFPADTKRIRDLLDRLAALQWGWPEATTTEAAVRFKVARDQFEHKMVLRQGGVDCCTLYFGTSPGLRKLYLRVDGDRDIQAVTLASHELDLKADNWIDTGLLHLAAEKINRITLPAISLIRRENELVPADLKNNEEVVRESRDALVKQIADMTISGLLGTEKKPGYGFEAPVLCLGVELEGGATLDYVFGRQEKKANATSKEPPPAEEESSVLQVSGQKQLFRVDNWQVDAILKATRATLVRPKQESSAVGQWQISPLPMETKTAQ